MIYTLPVPKRTPSIPQLGEDPLACILTANRVIAVAPLSGTAAPCGTMHKWTSLLPDSGTDQLLAAVAFLFYVENACRISRNRWTDMCSAIVVTEPTRMYGQDVPTFSMWGTLDFLCP